VTKTVYLAGPITGLSYGEAREGWRKQFASFLPHHIQALSPMRGHDMLKGESSLAGDPGMYSEEAMVSAKGITMRDVNDVKTCDTMVANFLGAKKASIGTAIEFGLAHAFGKPIVMIIEKDYDNPHNHAMLVQMAGYVCHDLESAAFLVSHLLTPGV